MAGGKIDILVEPDVKGFDRKLESGLSGAIGTAGKIGAALGLAVGGLEIGRQVIQVGTDFQSSMNTMAAVSQATAGQLDAVRAKARELGSDTSLTATSASDAAAAMTELAKGGFSVEQAMTAAKGTLQLAAAAQVDAAQAATIQAQALQAFSLDASHASRVSDILAGAANASSAEMTDVAMALQQAGTVSNQFGLSIDDATTAIAMFANAGITGSDAGTLLKTSLLALTDQGKPAQRAIAELGLTVYDANGKFAGLPLLIEELNQASKRMTKEQYDAATATLFGSDAIRFAGLAASQGSADFERLREAVVREGQAAEVAAAQTEGLPGALERFQNTKEEVLLGLFDAIQDDLVKAVDTGAAALEKLGPITASAFSTAASGVEALGAVISPIAGTIGDVNSALGGMQTSAIVAGAALAGLNAIDISSRMNNATGSVGRFASSLGESRRGVVVFQDLMAQSGVRVSKFDAAMVAAGTTNSKVLSSMGTAYSKAVAPMRHFEASQRQAALTAKAAALASRNAFDSIDRIGAQAAHSFAASGARIAGTARGAIAGSFGAIRAGASNVVNFLGGPWAVGLAAASFAVVGFVDGLSRMNAALEEMNSAGTRQAEGFRNLFGALSSGGEKITAVEQNVDNLMSSLSTMADNGPNWFHRSLLAIEDGLNSVVTVTSEYYETGTALRQASDDAKAATEKMAELGLTNRDLAEAAAGTTEAYDQMRAKLFDGSRGGEYLAQQFALLREQVLAAEESFERVGPAGASAAMAIAEVAEKSGSAADRANNLRLAFMELAGIEISAQEASAQLTKELDSVAAKAEQVAGATLSASGNIDVTNTSGVALQEALNGVGEAMTKAVTAGEDSHAVFDRANVQLEHLREQAGLGTEEWHKLIDAMGLTPEKLTIYAEIQADAAKAELVQVASKIQELEGVEASVNLIVKDKEARESLESFGFEVTEINALSGEVKISVSDEQALDRYQWWVNEGMPDIDTSEASMKVYMDTTELEGSAAHAKEIVDALAIEEPSPQAKLIIDDLLSGVDVSIGELARLTSESAKPQADLVKDLFDSGVIKTKSDLDRLSSITAVPRADLDTRPAEAKIGWLQRSLNAIQGFFGGASTASRSGGASASGRFASGGRLPTSGPGTDVVDGFLAIDGRGAPVARVDAGEWVINRRSSDQFNNTLAALNRGDGSAAVEALYNELPRHADGGRIQRVKKEISALDGTPYILGGWSLRGTDCSGAVSATVNSWFGLPLFHSRMSTVTEGQWLKAKGFQPGRGSAGDMVVGWWDRGGGVNGHTAMRLPDGTYVESGGNTGGGFTVGRTAGPLDGRGFTDWAHLKTGELENLFSNLSTLNLGSPSSVSSSVGRGSSSVNWGTASDLHDLTSRYINARLHDTGGLLPDRGIAVNLSGRAERILSVKETDGYGLMAKHAPELADAMKQFGKDLNEFGGKLEIYSKNLDKEIIIGSQKLGEIDVIANSQIVLDAEKGLAETRIAIAEETKDIAEAEKDLAEARRGLSKAERDSADKVAKAREKVAKARKKKKAKPEDIARAEKDLAKVRADVPDKVRKAAEKIEEAEEKVEKLRERNADAAKRLEIAERTLVAARIQAATDLVQSFTSTMQRAFEVTSEMFGAIAQAAEFSEQLRQQQSKLKQQMIRDNLAVIRSNQDLRIAEWEVERARVNSAVSVAQAEKALEEARQRQAKLGASSIEAMAAAQEQFRVKGRFVIADLAASMQENANAIKAAEWGVAEARAQAAIDLQNATHQQSLAQLAVAEATLTQAQSAELLRLKTEQLTEHAKNLYGLTPNQARGAQAAFGGIGKIFGGIGKVVGGIAAGFAAGGPVGAIIGGITGAIGGISDIARGSIDIHHNKKEMKKAWKELGHGERAAIVLGAGGAGVLNAAGGLVTGKYGPQAGKLLDGAGDKWADATIGSLGHSIESRINAQKRRHEDQTQAHELASDAQKLELESRKQALEIANQAKLESLKAQLEYANLKKQLAEASTKAEIAALTDAAKTAAARRDAMLVLAQRQEKAAAEQVEQLKALVEATRQGAAATGVKTIDIKIDVPADKETFSKFEMVRIAEQLARQVTGVEYVNARI